MNIGKSSLSKLIFMALCCDIGILSRKLISPGANLVTEILHIPGGIATSFSLMFVIVGAVLCRMKFGATLMCAVQSLIALCLGTTGSMGALAPIGYIVPGIVIDMCILLLERTKLHDTERIMFTNALAGICAALCANAITFRLLGPPLWLYLAVAFTSGIISGLLGALLIKKLCKFCRFENTKGQAKKDE